MKYLLIILLLQSTAWAQLSYKGDVSVSMNVALLANSKTLTEEANLSFRGHLEAEYQLSPFSFHLILDPGVELQGESIEDAFIEPGFTEGFVLWRQGNLDLSLGLEKLPLEYTRLSVPFSVQPLSKLGQAEGLLNARASIFAGSWRFRPVLLYRYQDEQLGGVFSVRKDFTDFELEATALYLDGLSLGLAGSGLLGDMVIYSEAWLLTNPLSGRGAVGLSGFLQDVLLTAELSYAPNPLSNSEAFPQILTQANIPFRNNGSWDINLGLGLTKSQFKPQTRLVQGLASLGYSYTENSYQSSVNLNLIHSEFATLYGLNVSLTTFY